MSEIQQALETIFSADFTVYRQRGFQRRIGFGTRPALVHIDLANAWTRPGNAFSCDGMDTIIPGVQRLNDAARAKGIPVAYTTTAYAVTEGPNTDMGSGTARSRSRYFSSGRTPSRSTSGSRPSPASM